MTMADSNKTLIALFAIPVQLIPDIDVPQAVVTTVWPGASPEEIESEIVRRHALA